MPCLRTFILVIHTQTPQRFYNHEEWHDPDPLGNQAATQFDIINPGRDGAGGVLSCGQGSVWRVQVGMGGTPNSVAP